MTDPRWNFDTDGERSRLRAFLAGVAVGLLWTMPLIYLIVRHC